MDSGRIERRPGACTSLLSLFIVTMMMGFRSFQHRHRNKEIIAADLYDLASIAHLFTPVAWCLPQAAAPEKPKSLWRGSKGQSQKPGLIAQSTFSG